MSDIKKIRLIHELKSCFQVGPSTVHTLINQIENSDYKENIERFFRGYIIEDKFNIHFSALPWTKLTHSLGQNQLPVLSKKEYQVPDYLIYYETSKKGVKPILFEVKSVKGDKTNLEVMSKQLTACMEYAKVINVPFLYAIYWEKYQHREYGVIVSDRVSINNCNYIEISNIESAIIDSFIKMRIVDSKVEGDKTTIIEKSEDIYFMKLSTLISRHIAILDINFNEKNTDLSRRIIIEFSKKLEIPLSYSIPIDKTSTSDKLYRLAFEGSWVYEDYNAE